MKKSLPWILTLLISVMLAAVLPTDADADIYTDTLRLHILANSDSAEDQSLKLSIRDKLLQKYGSLFSSEQSAADAVTAARSQADSIRRDIQLWLAELDSSYPVSVSVEREWYSARSYGSLTLPAGEYYSLRVNIGEGAGQNWWCIMYPPLCLDIATESAPADDAVSGYLDDHDLLIRRGKYSLKFKLLELCSELFS